MTDTMTDALLDRSAAEIGRALARGEADPVALAEAYLDRIAAADPAVFITVTAERARAEAEAARARLAAGRPAGPLDGVPIAWKDLFDMAGTVTTAASALLRHAEPAEADAPAVAALAAAGMVALGKTNLTEFAYSGLGLNPHFGTPANPFDRATPRAPGGSSSGSAVAVASGLAPAAIGTDTGGSIRVPAAFNGLVGYKPTEGRVPTEAAIPLSVTLDTVGPLARSVEDCIVIDAALRRTAPSVPQVTLSGVTIVVPSTLFLDDLEPAVGDAFEAAVDRLSAAGARVEQRRLTELGEAAAIMADHGTVAAVEAYAYHRQRVDGPDVQEMDGRVVARILKGKAMSAFDLLTIQEGRRRLAASLAAQLDGALILAPTTPLVAPAIAPLDADPDAFNRTNLRTLRNTMVGNFLNTPGVAMPLASSSTLPVSACLSGIAGADDTVLGAARTIEPILRGN